MSAGVKQATHASMHAFSQTHAQSTHSFGQAPMRPHASLGTRLLVRCCALRQPRARTLSNPTIAALSTYCHCRTTTERTHQAQPQACAPPQGQASILGKQTQTSTPRCATGAGSQVGRAPAPASPWQKQNADGWGMQSGINMLHAHSRSGHRPSPLPSTQERVPGTNRTQRGVADGRQSQKTAPTPCMRPQICALCIYNVCIASTDKIPAAALLPTSSL